MNADVIGKGACGSGICAPPTIAVTSRPKPCPSAAPSPQRPGKDAWEHDGVEEAHKDDLHRDSQSSAIEMIPETCNYRHA